jgi:hypothetical protein
MGDTLLCPSCGGQLRPQAMFCAACGQPVAQPSPPLPAKPREDIPRLKLEPDALDFGQLSMLSTQRLQVGLVNAGGGRLEANAQADVSWLSVIPGPYYLGPGQQQQLSVQINTTMLATMGRHAGQILIFSNNEKLALPVSVEITPPFILDPADLHSEVNTLQDMLSYCDANWATAVHLLAEGRLEACIRFLDKRELLSVAGQARNHPNANVGLELLLRAIQPGRGKRPPRTNIRAVESRLGFGLGRTRQKKPQPVVLLIHNPNTSGYVWGELRPRVPWLHFSPPAFGCGPRQTARTRLRVDAARGQHSARAWSTGITLFEIVLPSPDGKAAQRIPVTTSPGWAFIVLLIALTVLVLMLVGIAIVLYLNLL